jgi:hypothetical protein
MSKRQHDDDAGPVRYRQMQGETIPFCAVETGKTCRTISSGSTIRKVNNSYAREISGAWVSMFPHEQVLP